MILLNAPALAVLASLPRIDGNPYVIAGMRKGAPPIDIDRPWEAVRRHAELEGFRLHDLRHTFASFGASSNLGLPVIGNLLGHTHASTTSRYAHLADDPLRRAADRIGGALEAAPKGRKPDARSMGTRAREVGVDPRPNVLGPATCSAFRIGPDATWRSSPPRRGSRIESKPMLRAIAPISPPTCRAKS